MSVCVRYFICNWRFSLVKDLCMSGHVAVPRPLLGLHGISPCSRASSQRAAEEITTLDGAWPAVWSQDQMRLKLSSF